MKCPSVQQACRCLALTLWGYRLLGGASVFTLLGYRTAPARVPAPGQAPRPPVIDPLWQAYAPSAWTRNQTAPAQRPTPTTTEPTAARNTWSAPRIINDPPPRRGTRTSFGN